VREDNEDEEHADDIDQCFRGKTANKFIHMYFPILGLSTTTLLFNVHILLNNSIHEEACAGVQRR